MSAPLESLIHRVQRGASVVELVHTPHERWPLPSRATDTTRRLRISVLDSSYNPPTLAHLALASVPPSAQRADIGSDFDARLLLLSVRNADKSLKPGDATYVQRLEMMTLLANDLADRMHHVEPNVAVAIIDEPTFVGKSRVLHNYFRERLASFRSREDTSSTSSDIPAAPPLSVSKPELTFVVGIDTLERILAVRYYSTDEDMRRSLNQFLGPGGDDSRLICARRITPSSLEPPNERERRVTAASREYLEPDRVVMVDIGEMVESYSSSEVRQRIATGDLIWMQMVTPRVVAYIKSERLYLSTEDNKQ